MVTNMSNLSDDDINEVIGDGTCTHLPQVRMALEIRQHRSAVAASRERVRSVVRLAIADEVGGTIGEYGTARIDCESVDRIATRAAEQLATAAVVLSEEERSDIDALLGNLAEQRESAISRGLFATADVFRDQHTALAKLLTAGATR